MRPVQAQGKGAPTIKAMLTILNQHVHVACSDMQGSWLLWFGKQTECHGSLTLGSLHPSRCGCMRHCHVDASINTCAKWSMICDSSSSTECMLAFFSAARAVLPTEPQL